MKNITVAIPFYNSLEYFEDAIRIPLFDDRVDEILVVDDYSTEEQYQGLLKKVQSLLDDQEISFDPNSSLVPEQNSNCLHSIMTMTRVNVSEQSKKIKVIRNKNNLGGFANKYESVKNAKNDWVYLLDSDNFLVECSIPAIFNIDQWDDETCYCPSVIIMERKNQGWRAWDDWNHRRFGYDSLGLEQIQNLFRLDASFHNQTGCGLGTNGFLNTGNFFVNKSTYVDCLKEPIENNLEPYAADVIAFSYYWLASNNKFKIVPDLYYYHRLRSDSFWQRTGSLAGFEAQKYEEMIKNA